MKKEYTKPIIVFENFTLSTSIAANCDRHVSTQVQNVCAIEGSAPGLGVFSGTIAGCAINWQEEWGPYDGYCYHVPTPGFNLFHS